MVDRCLSIHHLPSLSFRSRDLARRASGVITDTRQSLTTHLDVLLAQPFGDTLLQVSLKPFAEEADMPDLALLPFHAYGLFREVRKVSEKEERLFRAGSKPLPPGLENLERDDAIKQAVNRSCRQAL